MVHLTPTGKKIFWGTTIGLVGLAIAFIWVCWPMSIIFGAVYLGFLAFNLTLNHYCRKLIDKNNAETLHYAEVNNYKVKYISPKDYDRLMNRDGADLGDNIIINKEEVTFI